MPLLGGIDSFRSDSVGSRSRFPFPECEAMGGFFPNPNPEEASVPLRSTYSVLRRRTSISFSLLCIPYEVKFQWAEAEMFLFDRV